METLSLIPKACSICEQSETYSGPWPFIDRGDGKQDIEFGACKECGSLNVCGDCLHENYCCEKTLEDVAWEREKAAARPRKKRKG